jgi:hypothetical protein
VPHWLHLGWISSTAGAAVKGDFEPRGFFFWGGKRMENWRDFTTQHGISRAKHRFFEQFGGFGGHTSGI